METGHLQKINHKIHKKKELSAKCKIESVSIRNALKQTYCTHTCSKKIKSLK